MSETEGVDSTEVDRKLEALESLIGRYVVSIAPSDTAAARAAFHGAAKPTKLERYRRRSFRRRKLRGELDREYMEARQDFEAAEHSRSIQRVRQEQDYASRLAEHKAALVDNVDLLKYLAAQGRDFSTPTDEMAETVLAHLEEQVQLMLDHNRETETAYEAIGVGALEHITKRFNGDNEVPMPTLKPRTVARKGHSRIGVESGALRDGIVHANVETRKVGR